MSGIRVRDLTSREPLYVLGSQGQLEQVFLNLFVHAEQSLADAPQKTITIRTRCWPSGWWWRWRLRPLPDRASPRRPPPWWRLPHAIAGHGERRGSSKAARRAPIPKSSCPPHRKSGWARGLGPERTAARFFRPPDRAGHRAGRDGAAADVGIAGGARTPRSPHRQCRYRPGTVAALAVRRGFLLRPRPRLNWGGAIGADAVPGRRVHLLSDRYDAELSADFEGEGRFVLSKPLQDSELDQVLRALEPQARATVIPIDKSGAA